MPFGVRLSFIVLAGASVGVVTSVSLATAAASAIAAVSLAVLAGRTRPAALLLWCSVASLACGYGAWARDRALAPLEWFDEHRGSDLVEVDGVLRSDAAVSASGVRLEITLRRVKRGVTWQTARGRLSIVVTGEIGRSRQPAWTAGRRVRLPVRLREPQMLRNPGAATVRWQTLTRPFDLVGSAKSGALVDVWPGPWWDEWPAAIRGHVRASVTRYLAPRSAQSAAVATAILIGDRAGLDDDTVRRLQSAGTFHVIAISGGNVALLAAVCFLVVRLATRSRRAPPLVTLLFVVAYGWTVGGGSSVQRAVLAASVYLAISLAGLVPRAIYVLSLVVLVCTIADPLVVVDIGAWLSFGATLGIVAIGPRLMSLGATSPAQPGLAARVWALPLTFVIATISAEIVILPVMAGVFGRVGLAGLLLNVIAIPAMTLVQVAGMALTWLAPWPAGAHVAAVISDAGSRLLIGSAALVDHAPWLSWRVPSSPGWWTVSYYGAVIVALAWRGRRIVRRVAIGVGLACLVVIVTAPGLGTARPAAGWLRVTTVDVGQGEAILIQFPGGRSLLVDAGGSTGSFDVGSRVVTPALWALGVRRLDWLAITHGDIDHVGGARRVVADLRPREVWEGLPVPLHPAMTALRADAQDHFVVWRRLLAGHSVEVGAVALDVLHPPAPEWERRRVRNDDSLVLRLRFGDVEMLLTGDAGSEFESGSAPLFAEARAPLRVLKVAHHGSRSSTSEAFLAAFQPQVALISAGRDNSFGHPAPEVIERLRRRRIDIFRTDLDGAISIDTDGRQVLVRAATGRRLRVVVERR